MAIFKKSDARFCSVPIPSIDAHKGDSFSFSDSQIAAYKQSQTHPSILYFENKFAGHDFWLATTPYPSATGVFENPCIYYADFQNDGKPPVIFTPINGGEVNGDYKVTSNPITKVTTSNDVNSDCDLVFVNGVLYMISRDNIDKHKPYVQKSLNGLAWTERDNSKPLWSNDNPEKVSPSFVEYSDSIYVYSITGQVGAYNLDEALNKGTFTGIVRHRGTTLENGGDFVYDCKINLRGARIKIAPWHLDVFIHDGVWYMVYCAKNIESESDDMALYMASSTDGVNFYAYACPLMDSYVMYRPTACVDNNGNLIIYFSTTNAVVDSTLLPNGVNDISPDGRYIGCLTNKLSDVVSKLEAQIYMKIK